MLTNENFRNVLGKEEFCLVLITGDGCANCSVMAPIVNTMSDKFSNLSTYIVDINQSNYQINEYYEVEVVPTVLFLHKGELVSKVKGYQPEEILEIYIDCKMKEFIEQKDYAN